MFCVIYAGSSLNVFMKQRGPTVRLAGMSNTICPGFLPSKGKHRIRKHICPHFNPLCLQYEILKFRYVFVYKKNVILIITKHVLYKECFPDELNYLFLF